MKKQSTSINNTAGTKRKMCLFWSGLGWTRKIKTVVSAVFLALHHQMQILDVQTASPLTFATEVSV